MNLTDFDGRTLVVSKAGNDALAVQQFAGDLDGSRKYSAHCHFLTVQAAIDFAQSGDNVNVHAGDYTDEVTIVLKDRVSITTDANVVLPHIEAIDVKTEIHGNPDIISERGLDVFGVSDLEVELGIIITERAAIRVGNSPTDVISLSGYTGDVITQSNNLFVTDGDINIDLKQDDIISDTNALRIGGTASAPTNRISIDWEARDCIANGLNILANGNSAIDARLKTRDLISTGQVEGDTARNKNVWLNSCKDETTTDFETRIDLHFRDMISTGTGGTQTLRVNSGVNEDVNGLNAFVKGRRIIYNGEGAASNADFGSAVIWSKGGGSGGRSYLTLDVEEILGREGAAIKTQEASSDPARIGVLRVINANLSNTTTSVQPIKVNNSAGSPHHITLEGVAIYTPDNLHITSSSGPDVKLYHKTSTLVNKVDQNTITPITDSSVAANNGTIFTRISDADLLEIVNV